MSQSGAAGGEASRDHSTRAGRQEMLLEAGLVLSSELSLPAVLQRIVELACTVTGARYGALGVLGDDGHITEFITTGITEEQRAAIGPLPQGEGLLGVLIHEPEPLRVTDIARDPRSVGFPPHHPPMRSFLGAPVRARGRVFGNIYLTEKHGGEFTSEDVRAVVVLATQAGTAIENARLYEEAKARQRLLEAVKEITTAILSESGDVLALVASRARELVGADTATVAVPHADGTLVLEVVDGLNAERLRGAIFPADGSVSGQVMRTGQPVLLENASADPRVHQPLVSIAHSGPALFVPLSAPGGIMGTLAVANPVGGKPLGHGDVALVETFAAQAAVAIEYGRGQNDLRQLSVLHDRERIAKELHDGAIQSLFAVGMTLQGTAQLTKEGIVAERIESAVEELDRVIRDLRGYIFALRPGILAGQGLGEALTRLARDMQDRSGVLVIADVDAGATERAAAHSSDLVQLAREALSNVERHAAAETCRMSLNLRDGNVCLEVDDDGRGFDPEAVKAVGQGLENLRERATAMGGNVVVESSPGKGATVTVVLPLKDSW